MKTGIHPLYVDTTISCVCGASYDVGTTRPGLKIEICSNCHPFFTGQQKIMDTEGRVERFRKRYASVGAGSKNKK